MKIITVTLNPAFDKHCYINTFTPFTENFFTEMHTESGGKGINISRALISYDTPSLAYVVVGKENGDAFLSGLDKERITYKAIPTDGAIRENITIHSKEQRETRLSFDGFSGSYAVLDDLLASLKKDIDVGDIVAISGSFFGGISRENKLSFVKEIAELGVKLLMDSRSFDMNELLFLKPYFIKPNEEELLQLIGKEHICEANIPEIASRLVSDGIANVMITLGENGAVFANREGAYKAVLPKNAAISTVGAGDSTIAGFIYGITHGLSDKKSFLYAMAFGNAACLRAGTEPPDKKDIDRLLGEIKIKKVMS